MNSTKLILIIPASFVMVLLVMHSLRLNGPAITRKFFFWCFLFCYTKEFINAHSRAPEYFSKGLEILGVPLMVPFGWVIAIYLSWFLAECILTPRGRNFSAGLPVTAVSCIIIAFISLMVECSGGNMRWWWWNYDIPGLWYENHVLKMPVKIIGGWATTNLIFMTLFQLLVMSKYRGARINPLKVIVIFLLIAIPIGILATNLFFRQVLIAPIVTFVIFGFLLVPILRGWIIERAAGDRVARAAKAMRGAASRNKT